MRQAFLVCFADLTVDGAATSDCTRGSVRILSKHTENEQSAASSDAILFYYRPTVHRPGLLKCVECKTVSSNGHFNVLS